MTDFLFFLKNQNKSTFLFLLLFTATMLSGKEFPEVVVPRFEKAPQLDGKLDDEIWQKTREYRFRNVLRNKKSPESFVRFGYDGNYLYFGMRFLEPEMAKRRVTRHDPTKEDIPADDNLDLQIIPCNANVYQLIGNSAGALYCNVDGAPWVSGAKCAFLEGEDFWSAEIAIPFSSLGWTPRGGERWKISVGRQRVIGGEKTWSTLADLSPLNFLTNAFPICFEGNPEQRLAVECQEKTVRVSIASRNAGKIAVTAFGSNRSRMKKIVPFAGGTGAEILTEFSFPFVVRSLNLELKDAAGSRYASEISLIRKEQRRYPLEGGLVLEVNQVDQGEPGSFFYAEVEFPTREAALAWEPDKWSGYLSREVTGQPGQSMAAYWLATRGHAGGVDAPAALEK